MRQTTPQATTRSARGSSRGGAPAVDPILPPELRPSFWEELLELGDNLPHTVKERLPKDASSQLDHYLYGTPKQSL
jgi:hypothetical protein